jgi:DNA repair exonuclease SbcCD ATPase subunit
MSDRDGTISLRAWEVIDALKARAEKAEAKLAAAEDVLDALAAREEAELSELRAEVERLHSWVGLMALLNEHWPESIFPTLADDEDRDTGPRIVSLLRWVELLTREVDAAHEKAEAEVERLTAENKTFRAAQKACETCDAPTMAAVAEMRNESAMIAQGIRHYERCSNVTSGDEMPCVRCQRDEARRLLEYLIKWCACRGTGTCVSGYVCTDVDCADARAFLREVGK